ncbi:Zn-ribbon domain-containing OB-fold protein [Patulibacter defluvii]|uniref:Zn-ribbon domain-containing OB-fold protein n=1 Tax=Patulibacter defluvii TaxID=3095358 RepID=UPI002A7486AE|nr:OB-fold domain-containing protein [Patulibacter sp. DM4]
MAPESPSYTSTDPELFRVEGTTPVLMGSRCSSCEISFYPRRWVCAVCMREVADVDFAGTGTLAAYTYVATPVYGRKAVSGDGYGIGQIDLDEGVRVQAVIGGTSEDWRVGQRFAARVAPIGDAVDGRRTALYEFWPDPSS